MAKISKAKMMAAALNEKQAKAMQLIGATANWGPRNVAHGATIRSLQSKELITSKGLDQVKATALGRRVQAAL